MAKTLSRTGGGRFLKRILTLQLLTIFLATAMLIFSVWSWWQYAYSSPNRVFWDMVDKSLTTSSFSKKVVQDDGQQVVTQVTQSRLSPDQLINSQTQIEQDVPAPAQVTTESVGTPVADFVRYTQLQTSQKGSNGQALDFTSVINQWGKSEQVTDTTNGQLFNETVLSVVPFGNLPKQQRADLVKQMKDTNVYNYSLDRKVQRSTGRYTYVYKVDINPKSYITMLKSYARYAGLTQLEAIDPSQYASAQPISVELSVDGWSHQLTAISFGGGSRVEQLSSYGALHKLQGEPTNIISAQELQTKLQSISTQ